MSRLKLVADTLSVDTVEALSELLDQAKAGTLKSIAFVASYKQSRFIVNVAGDLRRNPTLARGMVAYLDDFLAADPYHQDPIRPQ